MGDKTEELIIAARANDVEKVCALLDRGADPDVQVRYYEPVLFRAALNGNTEMARLLLERGADPNIQDDRDVTPLLEATDRGHVEIVRLLLNAGAKPDLASSHGRTPMSSATSHQRHEIVDLLLNAGVKMNLIEAVQACRIGIARELLATGADVNQTGKYGETALKYAVARNSIELVDLLIAHSVSVDALSDDGVSALMWLTRDDVEIVGRLLDAGAEINRRDETGSSILGYAVGHGWLEVSQLLLDRGADPDTEIRGMPAVRFAVEKGDRKMIERLLQAGANPASLPEDLEQYLLNKQLIDAIPRGESAAIVALLEVGADPNAIDPEGDSALTNAAYHSKPLIVQELLAAGADVTRRGSRGGWTALAYAAMFSDQKIVELLLDAGADMNLGGPLQTPYQLATENREGESEKILALLRARGADTQVPPEGVIPRSWLTVRRENVDPESLPERWRPATEKLEEEKPTEAQPVRSTLRTVRRRSRPRIEYQPGDEIWEFDNAHTPEWHCLAARKGYCIVRDHVPVTIHITMMS